MILKGQLYKSAKHGWKAKVIGKTKDGKWLLFVFDVLDDEDEKLTLLTDREKMNAISDAMFKRNIEEGTAILIEESPDAPTIVVNRLSQVD